MLWYEVVVVALTFVGVPLYLMLSGAPQALPASDW